MKYKYRKVYKENEEHHFCREVGFCIEFTGKSINKGAILKRRAQEKREKKRQVMLLLSVIKAIRSRKRRDPAYKREKENIRVRQRYSEDPIFKIKNRLRTRLRTFLRFKKRKTSAVRDLGCSVEFLKTYLENQFKPGMSWENWSIDGWHIDHIEPFCSFDLNNPEEVKKAVHYTNLRPLWARENLQKIASDRRKSYQQAGK